MPFIKHSPWPTSLNDCQDPEHKPPGMIDLEPGIHIYECPACKNKTVVRVPRVSL